MNKCLFITMLVMVIIMVTIPIMANSAENTFTKHRTLRNIERSNQGQVITLPAIEKAAISGQTRALGTISGVVYTIGHLPIEGAVIMADTVTVTSNAAGEYSLQLPAGMYTVTCTALACETAVEDSVVVQEEQTTTQNFSLTVVPAITDSFESYADFAMDFAPWINVDVDESITWGIENVNFPGSEEAGAFIVFNITAATPPITTWVMHSGNKFAGCFAAVMPADGGTGPNNDWLISPQYNNVVAGAKFSFWARSLNDMYGLERFKVGISSGGTQPANFTIVSGATYIAAPITWTLYEYTIPASFIGQNVRIAINCVSVNSFLFMVDDFTFYISAVDNEDTVTPVIASSLNSNYPNPFNPETTISYSVKGNQPVVVEVYNTKGQKVKTLVNTTKASGNYTAKWNGTDDNNRKVTSGVYFYKMNAGKYSATRKMILMQ